MAVQRRQFYNDEGSGHHERLHWLALDEETGRVFIITGEAPLDEDYFEQSTELEEFLSSAPEHVKGELHAFLAQLFEGGEDDFPWRRSLV